MSKRARELHAGIPHVDRSAALPRLSQHLYRLYGWFHRVAKRVLRGEGRRGRVKLSYTYSTADRARLVDEVSRASGPGVVGVNGVVGDRGIQSGDVYYGENMLEGSDERPLCGVAPSGDGAGGGASDARVLWARMLENAIVPAGWRNEGYLLAGYVREKRQWCLSSWTWTSAAAARYYGVVGDIDRLSGIANAFLRDQLPEGGWLVRLDQVGGRAIPVIAPNDSAYIATNALLCAYEAVGESRYLEAAQRCASWIMRTARTDGLVRSAMNSATGEWITENNIVDVGFTADLFCKLYLISKDDRYLEFADRFVESYIRVFFDEAYGAFCTSVDREGQQRGGHFARGQAWALEGLLPFYSITHEKKILNVIGRVTETLVERQNSSGGWPYNLSRRLMGEDCKGTPVIARALLDWHMAVGSDDCRESARRALAWCEHHTANDDGCPGGIFSYSVEGAVAHTMYSETAFTYASAYALEVANLLMRGTG